MPSLDEVIAGWDAWPYERRLAARYCAQVLGRRRSIELLFDAQTYARFCGDRQQRRIIRAFLRQIQSERPELATLPLPRQPQPRKSVVTCLAIEQFLRGIADSSRRLLGPELRRALEDVMRTTGLPADGVAPKDFCRPEIVQAVQARLQARPETACRSMAYRFFRAQAAAAGLAPEAQHEILAPLAPSPGRSCSTAVPEWIEGYLVHRRANGRQSGGALTALRHFERFTLRMHPELCGPGGHLDIARVQEDHVRAYVRGLKLEQRTRNGYFCHLRQCLTYYWEHGMVPQEAIRTLQHAGRKVPPEITYLPLDRLQRLRAAAFAQGDLMLRTVVGVMVVTGCRPGEALGLRVCDWDPVSRQVCFRGKARGSPRERWVPLESIQVTKDLKDYLARRPLPRDPCEDHLFITAYGHALCRDGAGGFIERFNELKLLAEISDQTTPIVLRKTFATMLRREGVGAAIRADLMGHMDIGSQQHYAETNFDESYDRALANWRKHHAAEDPRDGE